MKAKLLLIGLLMLGIVQISSAQEPVTITFWHTYNEVSPEHQTLVDTLIPKFEAEHSNIKVESVPYPYDGFRQALLTSAAGGEGPDLVRLDIIWSPEFAKQGVLMKDVCFSPVSTDRVAILMCDADNDERHTLLMFDASNKKIINEWHRQGPRVRGRACFVPSRSEFVVIDDSNTVIT